MKIQTKFQVIDCNFITFDHFLMNNKFPSTCAVM